MAEVSKSLREGLTSIWLSPLLSVLVIQGSTSLHTQTATLTQGQLVTGDSVGEGFSLALVLGAHSAIIRSLSSMTSLGS